MKKIITLTITLLLAVSFAFAQGRITRTLPAFTKIAFRAPGTVYLKQGSPQKVELEGNKAFIDELKVEVSGNTLTIGQEDGWLDWSNKNDEKNRIKVYITIPTVEGLKVSGSGDILAESKITAVNLDLDVSGSGNLKLEADASGTSDVNVSGSGNIEFKGRGKSIESNVSGSGKVDLDFVSASGASFSISGSGNIKAKGTSQSTNISISGSGKVLAVDFESNTCDVRIAGSGDVEISVKNDLDVRISGSGSVSYKGNPNHVNSDAAGSGRVRKL